MSYIVLKDKNWYVSRSGDLIRIMYVKGKTNPIYFDHLDRKYYSNGRMVDSDFSLGDLVKDLTDEQVLSRGDFDLDKFLIDSAVFLEQKLKRVERDRQDNDRFGKLLVTFVGVIAVTAGIVKLVSR
jgi:hypothetical protein